MVKRPKGCSLNKQYLLPTTKLPLIVMVWCGFQAGGIGPICIIEGTMNAEKYIKTLEIRLLLFKGKDSIFQDDGAP